VNITIPYRQHQLKQGLAMLILRDNAVVIATTDQPPKFQCGFLIRHIKKYGDFDDGFVFETGNKCPKGEKTFLIRCVDNKKLYNLLDGLAKRSITIQDVILKHKFSKIAISQGPLPKVPLMPHSNSPSFNFSRLSSQFLLKQNSHEIKGNQRRIFRSISEMPSDTPDTRDCHRPLTITQSGLSYYNMGFDQESYQNLGFDGQCIVPEVEYEIIPDDVPNDALKGVRGIRSK